MNVITRIILYFFLCIPVRSIPILILYNTNKFNFPISIFYLIIGVLFLWRSFSYTPNQKGLFGGNVWWQELRIFHGFVYLLVYKLLHNKQIDLVKKILIIDLLLGILKFLIVYK